MSNLMHCQLLLWIKPHEGVSVYLKGISDEILCCKHESLNCWTRGFPVNITSCKNLYINKILCEMLGKMHLSLLFYSAYFEDFSFVFETVWSNLTMRSLILILIITDRDRLTNPLLLLQSHLSPETESVRRGPAGLRFGAAAGAEQQESLLQTSPGF